MLTFLTGLYFGIGVAGAYMSYILYDEDSREYSDTVRILGALSFLFFWLPIQVAYLFDRAGENE